MRLTITALLSLMLAAPVAFCQRDLPEAVKLLERLSGEGVDVSAYVEQLNRVLELYRVNRSVEADALLVQVLNHLRELDSQLPAIRLYRWLRIGTSVATLLMIPPLFYYFFPRAHALVWAYSKRNWLVREVSKRGHRR
ncbi:MAG: hypothetical protein QXJ21_04315 [Thermofilum sp.]